MRADRQTNTVYTDRRADGNTSPTYRGRSKHMNIQMRVNWRCLSCDENWDV